MDRTPTDAEVERLAREVDDILFPDCSFPGTAFEYQERAYTLARHLIEKRGCQVPPDPVRERWDEAVEHAMYDHRIDHGSGWHSKIYASPKDVAKRLWDRFNVTPKEESDA